MKTIKGIEINEIEDLNYNLKVIRHEIKNRVSFWNSYRIAVEKYESQNKGRKAGLFYKTILFFALTPKFIENLVSNIGINNIINEAEEELISYFDKPISKVRRFRFKCEYEKLFYKEEMTLLERDIKIQLSNLNSRSIGGITKSEIESLLNELHNIT